MLPQFVISIIAVIVVVLIAAYGFTTRGYFVHLALAAAPFVVYLINHPATWMIVVLGLSKSSLIFPGLPQGLHVAHVMMAGLVALLIARTGIQKGLAAERGAADFFLVLFLGMLALTAYVRGFGIRALGGETWGGMSYIRLFITGAFLLTGKSLALNERQLRRALYLMLALSTLPALAQVVFLLSRGAIYQQYMFIEAYIGGLLSSLEAVETGGVVRFQMFGNVAGTIVMFAAILLDRRRFTMRATYYGLMLAAAAMAGLSGYRGQILYILAMVGLLGVLQQDRIEWRRIPPMILLVLLALVPIYFAAPILPAPMQRAFSWLPGIDIPWNIRYEATISTLTRTQVWEMAWNEVPRYLWIGKGFAVNPLDLISPTVRANWVLSSFLSHNYHSGPLSLLLDTGLMGFLFGSLFLVISCVEMLRRLPVMKGQPPLLERAYVFLLANHCYSVFGFFAIFGDVRESFPTFFINLTLMFAILNAARGAKPAPMEIQRLRGISLPG